MNPFVRVMIVNLLSVTVLISLSACTPNINADHYTVSQAGQASRVETGTIVSKQLVQVSGDDNLVGTAAGAGLGAVAGSTIGGGTRSNVAGAIGGAIVGGLLGREVQKHVTSQTGVEYIVKLTNGQTISVVQGQSPTLYVGQKVQVLFGSKVRVVPASTF